jgi:hypothetical protein
MNNASLNSSPLNSLTGVIRDFSDLPGYVTVSIPLFSDLNSSINASIEAFSDLMASIQVMPRIFIDFNSVITVAPYKFLSTDLLSTQQQNALTPYATCKIIDDDIVYNSKIFISPDWPLNGKSVSAPNGDILSVGISGIDNSLGFWKTIDGTIDSNWLLSRTPDTVFETTGSYNISVNSTISVSEYIDDIYIIDVYYVTSSGTSYTIKHQRSLDSGSTWSSDSVVTFTVNPFVHFSLAAMKPETISDNSVISGGIFFTVPDASGIFMLNYRYYDGTTWSSTIPWSSEVDSSDWVIKDIDCYSSNGSQYVYISGRQSKIDTSTTNSIFVVKLNNLTVNEDTDTWYGPIGIIETLSSNAQNLNDFLYPNISNDGEYFYLVFYGTVTDSVAEDGTITTESNYYICTSIDGENFTLPSPIADSTGVLFTKIGSDTIYSFVKQGSYYYIIGGRLWREIKNDYIADITNDLISYNISEVSGSPSSISLLVGNENGQWVGPSPTKTGYQAVAKNKKVVLEQGFYTSSTDAEICPKDIFYIDNIKQNIDGSHQDLSIVARNLSKKFKVSSTRFAYIRNGASTYVDIFSDPSLLNWSQISGTWTAFLDPADNIYTLEEVDATTGTDFTILLTNGVSAKAYSITTEHHYNTAVLNQTDYAYVYAVYIDPNNWLKLEIQTQSNSPPNAETFYNVFIKKSVGGVVSTIGNAFLGTFAVQQYIPISIVIHGNCLADFFIGQLSTTPQSISAFDAVTYIGQADFSDILTGTYNIAFGCKDMTAMFTNFKLIQYGQYQTTRALSHYIAQKVGVFSFKDQVIFDDSLFAADWRPAPMNVVNGHLNLEPNEFKVKLIAYNNDNADMEFTTQVIPENSALSSGFDFIFRDQNLTNIIDSYRIRFECLNGETTVSYLANGYTLASSSFGESTGMNQIDLSSKHTFNVVFSASLVQVFIDKTMVLCWYDNNSTYVYTSGNVGFNSLANSFTEIYNIKQYSMYHPVERFSINPGDDLESSLRAVSDVSRSFYLSDLMGRMKSIILFSTDSSNYTYNSTMYNQQKDDSDNEYIKQVIVIGNNVSATVKDSSLVSDTTQIRDHIIVDYKITTYKDALARANFELINFNKYNYQSDITHVNNVGSELYDVVTIILPDSGTSGNYRIYSQQVRYNSKDDSIKIGSALL